MNVALIDGNLILRRAYHTREGLTDAEGNPTGGIVGFLHSMRTTLADLAPDAFLVLFDGGTDVWRREIFPGYKDRREKDPIKEQIRKGHGIAVAWQIDELIKNLLPHLGVPHLMIKGVEADDLIYLARDKVLSPRGIQSIIVSGDNDFLQLVGPTTTFYDPAERYRKDRGILDGPPMVTLDSFKRHTGIDNPASFLQYRALSGDTTDKIPGIKGVGDKTARELIEAYGSISAIFQNKEAVKARGKRHASVLGNLPILARNLILMDLSRRQAKPGEVGAVVQALFSSPGVLNQDAVRSYCLSKQALDFTANLPELFLLLMDQEERTQAFKSWLAPRLRAGA